MPEVFRLESYISQEETITALCGAIEGTPRLRCLDLHWTENIDEDEMDRIFLALRREGLSASGEGLSSSDNSSNNISVNATVEEIYLPRAFSSGWTHKYWFGIIANFLKSGGIPSSRRLHLGRFDKEMSVVNSCSSRTVRWDDTTGIRARFVLYR